MEFANFSTHLWQLKVQVQFIVTYLLWTKAELWLVLVCYVDLFVILVSSWQSRRRHQARSRGRIVRWVGRESDGNHPSEYKISWRNLFCAFERTQGMNNGWWVIRGSASETKFTTVAFAHSWVVNIFFHRRFSLGLTCERTGRFWTENKFILT